LLENKSAPRPPVVSTHLPGTHCVITNRWRYITYPDGAAELYDRRADRHEFTNLASLPRHRALIAGLARHAPASSMPPVPDNTQFNFDFKTHTYQRKAQP